MSNLSVVDAALINALLDTPELTVIIKDALYNGKVPTTEAGKFPRVTVGNASDRDADTTEGATFNKTTRAISENIHLWSRNGRKELLDMYGAIFGSLHRSRLQLSTGQLMTGGTVTWVTDMLDPDGVTEHAILRFSAVAR